VEEKQGKAVIDAAVAKGVQYFVCSSGDSGGPERSAKDPTPVKYFAVKYNVEKDLEKAAATSPQEYDLHHPAACHSLRKQHSRHAWKRVRSDVGAGWRQEAPGDQYERYKLIGSASFRAPGGLLRSSFDPCR